MTNASRDRVAWFAALLAAAVLFALLETVNLAGQPDWLGSASTGWSSFLFAAAVYALLVAAASIVPSAFLYRFAGAKPDAGIYLAAAAVAAYLFFKTELLALLALTAVSIFCLIGFVAALAGNRFNHARRTSFALLAAAAFAAASLTAHEIRYAEIEARNAPAFAAVLALAVAAATILCGLYVWMRGSERPRPWTAWWRVALVALIVPTAARGYADYRGLFTKKDGPRVLLVTADTLRADYISLYGGHVPTPHLDALAAEGAVFDHAYALSSWTVPSLCCLMTSRFPPSTASDSTDDQWNVDITVGFPQLTPYWTGSNGRTVIGDLTHVGVPTAVFMANVAMLSHVWLLDEFECAQGTFSADPQRRGRFKHMPLLHAGIAAVRPDWAPYGPYDTSALTRDYARAYLRQHRHGPFFAWVHFLDPHAPYAPPGKFMPEALTLDDIPPEGVSVMKSFGATESERNIAKSLYEGEVRYVDQCIGDVIDALDDAGLKDSTLVCFSSDHGEEFWDHGEWGHGHSLYDELTRVPLIFRGPNVAPRRIPEPFSSIHVMPTIAGWMGVPHRPKWRGTDLSQRLADPNASMPDEPRFMGATYRFGVDAEPLEAVTWKQFKLIRGIRTGHIQLYDLNADPGETNDLSASMPDVVAKYTAILAEWNAGFPSRITDIWQRPDSMDNALEVREAFKALGYAE